MTDIWKLKNGNYLRRSIDGYVEFDIERAGRLGWFADVPADAVPMVPETGRQVTGEELFDAWENGFSAFSRQAEHEQRAWNSAAERLNLRVRETEPRQPWDVLREAADIVEMATGDNAVEQVAAIRVLERIADRLDAAAKEKSQREREIEAVAAALAECNGFIRRDDAAAAIDALDAVRGEQA